MIMTGRFTVKLDLQTLRTSPNHSLWPMCLMLIETDQQTDRQGQIYFEDFCYAFVFAFVTMI